MLRGMHSWKVLCTKPDGTSYLARFRAAHAETAVKQAMAEGHVVDTRVPPEMIPEPTEEASRWEPGEVGGLVAVGVALTAIVIPIMSVAAVVLGGMAASDSHGRRGWVGLILGIVVALAWQMQQR
jgi:hypothetical protein